MKLSILDQVPISANQRPQEALEAAVSLAKAGETFGYSRYWVAEHHNIGGLACPAPEILLGYIGAQTSTIRIGSGATLLPHYSSYKVAENYNLLANLFPGRIDLGIGRAPGGSAEATNALTKNYLQEVYKMPEKLKELLHFLQQDFPQDHPYATIQANPLPAIPPAPWLLGTSKKSGLLAAQLGLPYTFGKFMSAEDGKTILKEYKANFVPGKFVKTPQTMLAVSVICAETTEKAHELSRSALIWGLLHEKPGAEALVPSSEEAKSYHISAKEYEKLEQRKKNMIIGNPAEVANRLRFICHEYEVDEIMIVTITYTLKDKLTSYKLIANELLSSKSR